MKREHYKVHSAAMRAKAAIQEHTLKLKAIQDLCIHPKEYVKKEYKADTGNWDPYQDSFWVVKDCALCLKHWSVDSKQEGYRD